MDKFSFDFKQQKTSVVEKEGTLAIAQPYGEDANAPYSGQRIEDKDSLEFTKTRGRLEIK